MKPRTARPPSGKAALDLIEEAGHLLRQARPAAVAWYLAGTVPFLLGLLYFIGDMSHSAFAARRCALASAVMALLFIAMKTGHAAFALKLRARLRGAPPAALTAARLTRIAVNQAILQPAGLILLPLALIATVPFGWLYAYYQNLTALDDGELSARELHRRAKQQALLWPGGNHTALAILIPFGFFVYLNVVLMIVILPELLKLFTGIESDFTRGGWHINTTFFGVTLSLAWFCMDPLCKAFYILRCFYGESLHSGADLLGELRRFSAPLKRAALWLILLALPVCASASAPSSASAPAHSSTAASAPRAAVKPAELEQSIKDVLKRREYAWRMPREKQADADKGLFASFMDSITGAVAAAYRAVRRWIRAISEWIDSLFRKDRNPALPDDSGNGFGISPHALLYLLLAATLVALAVFLYRWRRGRPAAAAAGTAAPAPPDLRDDAVTADQLPESGWLALARDLMAKGDLRLALRALYLASLADLAQREIITIARAKSNREYERELRRRARDLPGLQAAFGDNVSRFERVWYGKYETTRESVDAFVANLERMKDPAAGGDHAP